MYCNACKKDYDFTCDYNQGQCPHHPLMIDTHKTSACNSRRVVSFAKSGLRIIAGYALINENFMLAGSLFITAELLNIIKK